MCQASSRSHRGCNTSHRPKETPQQLPKTPPGSWGLTAAHHAAIPHRNSLLPLHHFPSRCQHNCDVLGGNLTWLKNISRGFTVCFCSFFKLDPFLHPIHKKAGRRAVLLPSKHWEKVVSTALCGGASPEDFNSGSWSPQKHHDEMNTRKKNPAGMSTAQLLTYSVQPAPATTSSLQSLESGSSCKWQSPAHIHTQNHLTAMSQATAGYSHGPRALRAGRRATASSQTTLHTPKEELQPSSI